MSVSEAPGKTSGEPPAGLVKTCFVICPIGSPNSEARTRSDELLQRVITPALTKCGYEPPERADIPGCDGLITAHIIDRLAHATLVIADLTGHNANVFYELAVRHTLGLPVVQLISVGDALPFDVADVRTIHYDLTEDGAEAARAELVGRIRQADAQPSNAIQSMVTLAISLEQLKRKADEGVDFPTLVFERLQALERLVLRLAEVRPEAVASAIHSWRRGDRPGDWMWFEDYAAALRDSLPAQVWARIKLHYCSVDHYTSYVLVIDAGGGVVQRVNCDPDVKPVRAAELTYDLLAKTRAAWFIAAAEAPA